MKSSLLYLFILLMMHSHGQTQKDVAHEEVLDTNTFLFIHDLKYFGKSTTVSQNYQYVMQFLQEQLEANPKWTVHVRGHVCCGPSKSISRRRARKAYRFLKKIGVRKERISHMGYSDDKPLVYPERTKEDAQKNRRVDFLITKQ